MLPKDAQDLVHLRERLTSDLNRLTTVELLERNWESARKSLDKLLDLVPQDETALANQRYLDRQMEIQKSISEAETLFQTRVLLENGQHDQAASLLEDFLRHTPDHEEARRLYEKAVAGSGIALSYQGGHHCLDYAPDNTDVSFAFPGNGVFSGSGGPAADISVNPDTLEGLLSDARNLAESGMGDAAILGLKKLLDLSPDFAPAHNNLAILYYDAGDRETARFHYEEAVRLSPGNATFRKNLADFLLVAAQDMEGALRLYTGLLSENPHDPEVVFAIGEICALLNQPNNAREFYQRTLEIAPFHEAARERLEQKGQREAVVEGEKNSPFIIRFQPDEEESGPQHEEIRSSLASAHSEMGDISLGTTPLERMQLAVEQHPTDARAHHVLATGYYHVGDREKALEHYEKAAELAPGDTDILRTLADFHYAELGRVEDAVELYEAILAESPEDADVVTILGHIHLSMGNHDDARFYYEKALALNPDDERIREFLSGIPQQGIA